MIKHIRAVQVQPISTPWQPGREIDAGQTSQKPHKAGNPPLSRRKAPDRWTSVSALSFSRDCSDRYAGAVVYLFTAGLQREVLAALMTFSPDPWYAYYAGRTAAWGFTPLQDQQLAGLIMWFPGSLVLTLLTIGYFAAWLRALEQRSQALGDPAAGPGRR